MKNLQNFTKPELRNFLDSFDIVFVDVHGVLLNVRQPIPGAPNCIKLLQKLGKKVVVASNNGTDLVENFRKELNSVGFNFAKDEIVTPLVTQTSLLAKHKITKKVFVLGTKANRTSVQNAGFQLAKRGSSMKVDNLQDFVDACTDLEDVGAVICDYDIFLNHVNIQRAILYLSDPKVMFLKGPEDLRFPIGNGRDLLGPGCFTQFLEEVSGRKAVPTGKPSQTFKDYILEKYDVKEPSRALFIGDAIESDLGFATMAKFQKLLVLSGATKKHELEEWKHSDELKPDFFVDNLNCIYNLITDII